MPLGNAGSDGTRMTKGPSSVFKQWFFIGVLVLITIYRVYMAGEPERERNATTAAAAIQGEILFADAGLPEGAFSIRAQSVSPHTNPIAPYVEMKREFARSGDFADTAAWYHRELPAKGWKVWDPSSVSIEDVDFCQGSWSLDVKHVPYFQEQSARYHHFELHLVWFPGPPRNCPKSR